MLHQRWQLHPSKFPAHKQRSRNRAQQSPIKRCGLGSFHTSGLTKLNPSFEREFLIAATHMSALGQKQTCAVQKGMFALPPIATSIATIYAQLSRSRIDLPITQSLSSSDKNDSSSVKCVMRCL